MLRPIAFDITHLVTRMTRFAASGIDRVDLAYGRHFAGGSAIACGVHYGLYGAHTHGPPRVRRLLAGIETTLREHDASDEHRWQRVLTWLAQTTPVSGAADRTEGRAAWLGRLGAKAVARVVQDPRHAIPRGALYLNVAQHAFEHHRFFRWLDRRPDITPVFFVHDLLPLDYPEFFPARYEDRHRRRVETIVAHAGALIVASDSVAKRLGREYDRVGRPMVPVHVAALPSPLGADPGAVDPMLAAQPYFVMVATIEPRKNHLLVLDVWRALARSGGPVPKLVLVGRRGWENEQIVRVLTQSPFLTPHVLEVPDLAAPHLRQLIANARGVLMPSFAEGYGLPVVEGLSLGTPVVASDIDVFRSVSQGRAILRSPIDGKGWSEAIRALSEIDGVTGREARARIAGFDAPRWPRYFEGVEDFLARLPPAGS